MPACLNYLSGCLDVCSSTCLTGCVYVQYMCLFACRETQFLPFVIRHYGDTLRHGNKFIYQSIPRLLTLWLDFGASLPDAGGSRSRPGDRAVLTKTLEQLNTIMAELLDQLPPYQFLIAFSQLISRICHPNSEVFMLIQVGPYHSVVVTVVRRGGGWGSLSRVFAVKGRLTGSSLAQGSS